MLQNDSHLLTPLKVTHCASAQIGRQNPHTPTALQPEEGYVHTPHACYVL